MILKVDRSRVSVIAVQCFESSALALRHIGKEQPTNILQAFLNEFLNLSKPSIKPPAISREEFFADILEFPFALPEFIEQRGRSMPFGNGSRQVGYQCLQLPETESVSV